MSVMKFLEVMLFLAQKMNNDKSFESTWRHLKQTSELGINVSDKNVHYYVLVLYIPKHTRYVNTISC